MRPLPHDFHHQPPFSIEAQFKLERSLSLKGVSYQVDFSKYGSQMSLKAMLYFTCQKWRRAASWIRTTDHSGSRPRYPGSRRSPACTAPSRSPFGNFCTLRTWSEHYSYVLNVSWPHRSVLPRVPFEIFQIDPQLVVVAPGQHVDVFVAEPKLLLGGAEAVLVFIPIAIETLSRLAVVAPSLYYLKCKCSCPQS